MGGFLKSAFSALQTVAFSPLALVGYVVAVIAWAIIAWRVKRNKNLLKNLEKLPEEDRLQALELEMGAVRLKSGLTPEQWIRSKIHFYYLIGFTILCLTFVIICVVALINGSKKVRDEEKRIVVNNIWQNNYKIIIEVTNPPTSKNLQTIKEKLQALNLNNETQLQNIKDSILKEIGGIQKEENENEHYSSAWKTPFIMKIESQLSFLREQIRKKASENGVNVERIDKSLEAHGDQKPLQNPFKASDGHDGSPNGSLPPTNISPRPADADPAQSSNPSKNAGEIAFPQNCDIVLAQGVFKEQAIKTINEVESRYRSLFSYTYKQLKQMHDSKEFAVDVSVPIAKAIFQKYSRDRLPVVPDAYAGSIYWDDWVSTSLAQMNENEYENLRSSFHSATDSTTKIKSAMTFTRKVASKVVFDAWVSCIEKTSAQAPPNITFDCIGDCAGGNPLSSEFLLKIKYSKINRTDPEFITFKYLFSSFTLIFGCGKDLKTAKIRDKQTYTLFFRRYTEGRVSIFISFHEIAQVINVRLPGGPPLRGTYRGNRVDFDNPDDLSFKLPCK